MDRNILRVIDKILKVIPPNNVTLIREFESLKKKSMYTAPELMCLRWEEGEAILATFLTAPEYIENPSWQYDVITQWLDNQAWQDRML